MLLGGGFGLCNVTEEVGVDSSCPRENFMITSTT